MKIYKLLPVVAAFGLGGCIIPPQPGSNNGGGNNGGTTLGGCTVVNDSTLSEDTTWSDSCYAVSGTVDVDSGTLTIKPGTTIVFGDGASIRVNEDGKLSAVGTADKHIVFKGKEETPGYWGCIEFWGSNSVDNKIAYADISDGGGNGADYLDYKGAVILNSVTRGQARAAITNTTVTNSTTALIMGDGTILDGFENNTLTGNDLPVLVLNEDAVHELLPASSYSGNTHDFIKVAADSGHAPVASDQTWSKLDVPYRMMSNLHVKKGLLTIEAGTTIQFDANTKLVVTDDGKLTADGTDTDKVTLTGVETTPGYWNTVEFWGVNSTDNVLKNVVIDGAGGGDCDYHDEKASICVNTTTTGASRVSLEGVEVKHGGGDATIFIDSDGVVSSCDVTVDGGAPSVMPDTMTCPTT